MTLTSNRDFTGYLIQARVPIPGLDPSQYRIVGTMHGGLWSKVLHCNSTAYDPATTPLPVRIDILLNRLSLVYSNTLAELCYTEPVHSSTQYHCDVESTTAFYCSGQYSILVNISITRVSILSY